MVAWRQYSDARFDARNSFSAVLDAWNLRWNCIKDVFHEAHIHLSEACAAPVFAGQLFDSGYMMNDQTYTSSYGQALNVHPGRVVAFSAFEEDLLHASGSSVLSRLPIESPHLNSNSILKPVDAALKAKKVQFDFDILLHIGIEDELNMATVVIHHDDLNVWRDKPWSKKSTSSKACKSIDRSDTCPSQLPRISLRQSVGKTQNSYHGHGRQSTKWRSRSQALAAKRGANQNGRQHHNDEVTALVQTARPAKNAFKNAPADNQNVVIFQAFQEGQIPQEGDFAESDHNDQMSSDGYSPSDGPDESEVHPPSSEGSRQDVILYHMNDQHIRALVSWSNYEDMMREIAHHFALERNALTDAYEVVCSPPDIDPGVVPTIVHVDGDIPPDSSDRLVLFDIEFHAHRVEAHFRSGPSVIRQVIPLVKHANRNEVLATAKIDRYCRAEGGRCLVFINSRRWPDYDPDRKTIVHGDYIRIAIPPSDRFACSTEAIVDMTQRGLTDQEVYDHMFQDETASGFSPDLLDAEEVRSLAINNDADIDELHLMQAGTRHTDHVPEMPTSRSDSSTEDPIPDDWFLDLQRIVAPLESCGSDVQQEFIFSVYTWFVDHQSNEICREPKIVVLGRDPAEWAEDIRQPWMHRILHDDFIFTDLVQPFARRAGIEEHIAHLILTKNHDARSSILISIEFVDEVAASVIVRFALTLPKRCKLVDVIDAVPLLAAFIRNKREWITPNHQDENLIFHTWSGMGLFVKVFQLDGSQSSAEEDVDSSMIQLSAAFPDCQQKSRNDDDMNPVFTDKEHTGTNQLDLDLADLNACSRGKPDKIDFSLTDEFIRFVQAVGSQAEGTGPQAAIPDDLPAQPLWIQDIWEKWVEAIPQSDEVPQEGPRIETWFSNPQRWSRCRESRLVVLSPNYHFWERELLAAWPDKADLGLPTQFALVFPTPEDADSTAQEQLVIEQQSEPFSRTIVATLYDTNIDAGRPHSIALVVGDRFDLRSFILLMGYNLECPPEALQNECLMWMGNIAIRHDHSVNVRLGNAFRLLIRRGVRVSLQELLSMSDHRLREELQSAISGQIFRRPNLQSFPADAFANNNPVSTVNPVQRPDDEYPPDWLNSLQECFDRYATIENADEGRVMYVLVWFLNGGSYLRNESPKPVRLDADSSWWRTELAFPWRELFGRGCQTEIHFIDPIPISEAWTSHSAHVVISQMLPTDHVPVLVTVVDPSHPTPSTTHTALVVHQFSSAQDIAQRFDIAALRSDSFTVSRGRNVFPHGFTVRVGPGDGLCLRIQPREMQESSQQPPVENNGPEPLLLTRTGTDGTDDAIGENQDDVDLEEAMLMQALHTVHGHPQNESNVECAIGIGNGTSNEGQAFQFNPAAAEFLPSINALPHWAQVIEDIYHDWDLRAFAWQGEARVTHFMTWYLAPGLDRFQCLHGRRIALFADFWNWREQFRRRWIDEIDPIADIDIEYVSPPPTQIEAGITGHIFLIQYNSVEWSSVLVSVFDQAVNAGHPYHMAHSFPERIQLQQIVDRIGYAAECNSRAQCQFRMRGQLFTAANYIRASDGDAIDVLVHRVVVPIDWNPPVVPHMPGAEGLELLQIKAQVLQRTTDAHASIQPSPSHKQHVSLDKGLGAYTHDIDSIPFTLERLFQQPASRKNDLVVCLWEMHESVDMQMCSASQFDMKKSRKDFCDKHALLKECSRLFPVNSPVADGPLGQNAGLSVPLFNLIQIM